MDLLIPLLLVALLVPMFLAMRRQKKELAKQTEMQDSLKAGDRVMTTSGLQGIVVELDESTVDLEIAEDVVTTWTRAAIREVIADDHFDESAEAEATGAASASEVPPLEQDSGTRDPEAQPRLNKD